MTADLLGADPATAADLARQLTGRAELLDDRARRVTGTAARVPAVWTGASATAFTAAIVPVPTALVPWADRMRLAAQALAAYARTVADLQTEAILVGPEDPRVAEARRAVLDAEYAAVLARTTSAILDLCADALGLKAGTGVLDATQLAVAEGGGAVLTPAQAAALFADLTPAQAELLATTEPDVVGVLDGVPLALRAEANRLRWQRDVDALRAGPQTPETARRLAVLLGLVRTDGARIVVYDPDHERYAVMLGDAATAAHVAVLVPGVGTADDVDHWLNTDAANVARSCPDTAVILWKGYDDPDLPNAALLGRADAGALGLRSFVDGLSLAPTQTLTLVGHSYGSVVVGTALARTGVRPTNVVVAGSPGMTVDHVSDLHLPGDHVFVLDAPGDPVSGLLGGVGDVPSDPGFGATRLRTNAPGDPVAVRGHSAYFTPGSPSLQGIRDVVTGAVAPADVQPPSVADEVRGAVGAGGWDPVRGLADGATQRYHGPGSGLLQAGDHLYDGVEHDVGHAAGTAVDTAADALRRVGGWF